MGERCSRPPTGHCSGWIGSWAGPTRTDPGAEEPSVGVAWAGLEGPFGRTRAVQLWFSFPVALNFLAVEDVDRDRVRDVLLLYKTSNSSSSADRSCADQGEFGLSTKEDLCVGGRGLCFGSFYHFCSVFGKSKWLGFWKPPCCPFFLCQWQRGGPCFQPRHRARPGSKGRHAPGEAAVAVTHSALPRGLCRLPRPLHVCGCCVRGQGQHAVGQACGPGHGPRGMLRPAAEGQRRVFCLHHHGHIWFFRCSQSVHR